MPRTLCHIFNLDCGHICNAFCKDGLHCDVMYLGREATVAELQAITPCLRVVRIEPAPEAPKLEERSDIDRFLTNGGPVTAAAYNDSPYLEFFEGCPVPCPQQEEH